MTTTRISRLENGLTLITETMPWLETSSLGVWFDAGTRAESEVEHGFAHLLEHMAFKGTATRSALDIAEEIELVGGDLNAATGYESTAYYARMLKGDEAVGFDILSDILLNPSFDAEELRREKNVVVQEIASTNDTPDDLVYDLFQEAAFGHQPLGRAILGTPQTVHSATPQSLQSVLKSRYRAPNMVVVAVSPLSHEDILRLVEPRFAPFASQSRPGDAAARFQGGLRRDERDAEQLHLVIGFESLPLVHPDYFSEQVLATVLGGGMSSRLFQEVRERRGLCYHISAFHWAFNDTGIFGFTSSTDAGDAAELVESSLDTIRRAKDDLTEREVQKARAQLKAHFAAVLESPMSRAEQLARQHLTFGKVFAAEDILRAIDAVSLATVKMRLDALLAAEQGAMALVGPTVDLPNVTDVTARLRFAA